MDAVYTRRAVSMSYYEDLSPCKYFGPNNDKLIAIGWLAPKHEYARGDIDAKFFRAL